MISYFIEFSVFLVIFWGVYAVFFRKETFFVYNRMYLLIVPIASAILPFLRLSFFNVYPDIQENIVFLSPILLNETSEVTPNTIEKATNTLSFFEAYGLVLVYGLGVCIALLLWLKRYRSLQKMKSASIIEKHADYCIATVKNSRIACTFFKTVFLGDRLSDKEKGQILAHELTHVRQKHSIDLLFFEVLKVAFWFHLGVYKLQWELLEVHEFIADAQAVKKSDKTSYYQGLLNYAFGTKNFRYVNQFFNHSFIKKRIIMLHKSKSNAVSKLKYLLIVPFFMAMLVYVSCAEEPMINSDDSEVFNKNNNELKEEIWEELKKMKSSGASMEEISSKFSIENNKSIKSEEAFYRGQAFFRYLYEEQAKKNNGEEIYDAAGKTRYEEAISKSYEDYVAEVKNGKYESRTYTIDNYVPFAQVDILPVYPGCDAKQNKEEQQQCMSEGIKKFVTTHFDVKKVKPFAKEGVNRVYVKFTIGKDGKISEIDARASAPELAEEAKRVVKKLPTMTPGIQDGETVGVLYTLPVIFQVDE